jgi:mono/diheme cytochrome c family protein
MPRNVPGTDRPPDVRFGKRACGEFRTSRKADRRIVKLNASNPLLLSLVVAAGFSPHGAFAADAANGKRLAEQRCAACHIVAPHQREDVSNSPPFDVIAGKYGFDAQTLAYSMLEPHPRMNVTLTRSDADDIATYIATLGK